METIIARVELRAAPNAEAYKLLHRGMAAIGFVRFYQNKALPPATYVREGNGTIEAALNEVKQVANQVQERAEIVLSKGMVLTDGLLDGLGIQALSAAQEEGTLQEKLDRARAMFWRREPNAELDEAGERLLNRLSGKGGEANDGGAL